jgi:hypothetical protein
MPISKVTLVEDHWTVLRKSWSVRLMWLSGVLQAAYNYWPNLDFLPWWSSLAVLGLAFGARFIAQRGLSIPEESEE